jgi:hypothetical protein
MMTINTGKLDDKKAKSAAKEGDSDLSLIK